MGVSRSTKLKQNNYNKITNLPNDPDRKRTILSEIDFENDPGKQTNSDPQSKSKDNSSANKNSTVSECQVVLEDVLSGGPTGKYKMLIDSPDNTHSAYSHRPIDKIFLNTIAKKERIAWPRMNDSDKWNKLDSAVAPLLVGLPTVHERIALLESVIYSQASLIFGHLPPPKRGLRGLNRRAQSSIKLVIEKNVLLNQLNSCSGQVEKDSIIALLDIVRSRLRSMRKGEKSRKTRWKIKQANASFNKNPYEAGKKVLVPNCNIKLQCDKTTLDKFKSSTLSDLQHSEPLPILEDLPPTPKITKEFNSSNLKRELLLEIVNSRRNASSPGINMIPYKVYKKCPQILSFLFKIFQSTFKLECIPIQWRIASEAYIPKVNPPNSSSITDFRPIALLNVEGKLFFSLISKRLEQHIIHNNKFVDVSVQKGCMAKVPGCWEHMSMVWNDLKMAKQNKSSLTAVWLDIANAYGSVPHSALDRNYKILL